uniref:Phorbol-ester/DAG-type domain-containing protein n=1 Tax=Romanomermis culicivorax TaxID=13658 RepID=A0A915IT89_ROMCU
SNHASPPTFDEPGNADSHTLEPYYESERSAATTVLMPPSPEYGTAAVSTVADHKGAVNLVQFAPDLNNGAAVVGTEDFSVAKRRWLDAYRKVCDQLGHKDGSMKDVRNNDFFTSINAMPSLKLFKKKSVPLVSELTMATKRAQAGLASAARSTFGNEELKMHVYRKTLQALLFPISISTPHNFQVWTATKPTYCYECGSLLWGIARQGLRCQECRVKCHEKCKDLLSADCLQSAAERSSKHNSSSSNDRAQSVLAAMRERMKIQERNKSEIFDIIKEIFDIEKKIHHETIKQVKQCILEGTAKWSAKIAITGNL